MCTLGLGGFKLCRLLKFDRQFKSIPVIMLTVLGQEANKAKATQAGANEYIAKPFNLQNLLKLIKKHLGE